MAALDLINQVIPGFNGLTSKAAGIIGQNLSGTPSPDNTRLANAYFGVNSGMPGSEFVRNRGFDLYKNQANQQQQTGMQDLLGLLQGVSGTAVPTAGQDLQNNQFNQSLQAQQTQNNADNVFRDKQFAAQFPWLFQGGSTTGDPRLPQSLYGGTPSNAGSARSGSVYSPELIKMMGGTF